MPGLYGQVRSGGWGAAAHQLCVVAGVSATAVAEVRERALTRGSQSQRCKRDVHSRSLGAGPRGSDAARPNGRTTGERGACGNADHGEGVRRAS
jgi:hypothetical protein